MEKKLFKVEYPKWFNIFLCIVCIIGIFIIISLIVCLFIYNLLKIHIIIFFIILFISAILLLYYISFYQINVYDTGIISYNILNISKSAKWDDIVLVKRLLNYPFSLIVLFITKDNSKIHVVTDMPNFDDLLKILKDKNPYAQLKLKYKMN